MYPPIQIYTENIYTDEKKTAGSPFLLLVTTYNFYFKAEYF